MKRTRYADEQATLALWQPESGTSVEEICCKMGVSEPTWRNSSWAHSWGSG
jgi:putative transposase